MKVLSKHTHPLIPDLLTNCAVSRVMTRTREQTVTNRFFPRHSVLYLHNKQGQQASWFICYYTSRVNGGLVVAAVSYHMIYTKQPAVVTTAQCQYIVHSQSIVLFIIMFTVDHVIDRFACFTPQLYFMLDKASILQSGEATPLPPCPLHKKKIWIIVNDERQISLV